MSLYQRILVPVDGSETANAGIDEAVRIAKLTGGQIRLLHVVQEPPHAASYEGYASLVEMMSTQLSKAGAAMLSVARDRVAKQGVAVDSALHDSGSRRLGERAAEEAQQWGADLIVLGTHGRTGVDRLMLGSGAEKVMRSVSVPVLLVRGNAT